MTQGHGPASPVAPSSAGLGAAVLPAAGCGIRLEDDAPRVPLVPTRTPVPAEAELVALTRDTAALAEAAATVPGALAADLATIHRRQHTVLRTTLVRQQVPAARPRRDDSAPLDASASPTASGTTGPSGSSSPTASTGRVRPATGAPRWRRPRGRVRGRCRHVRRGGSRPPGRRRRPRTRSGTPRHAAHRTPARGAPRPGRRAGRGRAGHL